MKNSSKIKTRCSFYILVWLLVFPYQLLSYPADFTRLIPQEPVKGQVVDALRNIPLVGVTITIQGTSQATQTDAQGNFSLIVAKGQFLVASMLGYQSLHMTVGSSGNLTFRLQPDLSLVEEVVVVGYGTQRKKEVTSAISSIKSKDFNRGGFRSPIELIQGKVAGLSITPLQGSNPNGGYGIQLRGMSSISGSLSPLVVVDGVPVGGFDLVRAGDIESIDVLKDGSAAAIYGTRGNNGVILVTTKRGKNQSNPQFDYSASGQREFLAKTPSMLSAEEFRGYMDDSRIAKDQDFGSSTDLYAALINKRNFTNYQHFAATGGAEKSNYRIALNYEDEYGIARENAKRQYSGRLNISQTGLKDRLTYSVSIAGNFNKANLLGGKTSGSGNVPDFEQAVQRNPTAPLYNEDGTFYQTQGYNNYNPLSRFAYRIDERNGQIFSIGNRLALKINDYFVLRGLGFYSRNTYNDRLYRSTLDWDQRTTSAYQGTGYASKLNRLTWSKTLEGILDYTQTFSKDHQVTGMLGYTYQYTTAEQFNMANSGFTTDGFVDWNMESGTALTNDKLPRPTMGSFKEDNTLIAFFGRATYNYANKYFLSAILRREGSSRFGANNKWGNFPAVSVGWQLTEESFLKSKELLSNAKLRVGLGITGNQDIGNYQSLITLGPGGVYPQDGVYYQTYGPTKNPNPNLRWEQKTEWNVGLDLGFLKNRLTMTVDWYTRLTKDLLYSYRAQLPGFLDGGIFTNVGSIQNRGIELQISALAVQKPDFSWSIDFTGNYQRYKLTRLSNDIYKDNWLEFGDLPSPGNLGAAIRLEEGGEVGAFYGKRFAGFTDDGKWLFYKADGTAVGAKEITRDDLAYIGNGVPKFQAAINNRFTYKGFSLSVFFRGKFKFDILNTPQLYFGNKKWLPNNVLKEAFMKHDKLNDDPQYSNYYLENGSFVKLDNLTFGYNFKLSSSYIRNLYVYMVGRNLGTITSYSGLDPEIKDTGFDAGIDWRGFYPRTRSWSMGLNVGF